MYPQATPSIQISLQRNQGWKTAANTENHMTPRVSAWKSPTSGYLWVQGNTEASYGSRRMCRCISVHLSACVPRIFCCLKHHPTRQAPNAISSYNQIKVLWSTALALPDPSPPTLPKPKSGKRKDMENEEEGESGDFVFFNVYLFTSLHLLWKIVLFLVFVEFKRFGAFWKQKCKKWTTLPRQKRTTLYSVVSFRIVLEWLFHKFHGSWLKSLLGPMLWQLWLFCDSSDKTMQSERGVKKYLSFL